MDCKCPISSITYGDVACLAAKYFGDIYTIYTDTSINAFGGGQNSEFAASYRSKGLMTGTTHDDVKRAMGEVAEKAHAMLNQIGQCRPRWYSECATSCNQPPFVRDLVAITGLNGKGQSNVSAIARTKDDNLELFPVKLWCMARDGRPQNCYEHDLPPDPPAVPAGWTEPGEGEMKMVFDTHGLYIFSNNSAGGAIPALYRNMTFRRATVQAFRKHGDAQVPIEHTIRIGGNVINSSDSTRISGNTGDTVALSATFKGVTILKGLFTIANSCDYYSGVYSTTFPRYSHYAPMLEHIAKGCNSATNYARRSYAALIATFIEDGYVTAVNAAALLALDDAGIFGGNFFETLKVTVWQAGKRGDAISEMMAWYQATICLLYIIYMYETQCR